MGYQIIKQPNGKYLLFGSVCDHVTDYDCTEEEIIERFVEEQREQITKRVKAIVESLEKGEDPYHQFSQSYEEMMQFIEERHGECSALEIRQLIEK